MKSNTLGGKIFFFKTDKSPNSKDCFSPLLEVNSNFNNLQSLNLTYGKAYGITINDELLEWEFEKKKINKSIQNEENPEATQNYTQPQIPSKKNDFYFLLAKPSYRFHKMKIKSIYLNKTMCISLDINGNVLVWGQSKDGLLGLGYEINSVENPTILDGLVDIVDISLSDYHAVALNSSGNPFSWGLGKYGELGLERSIYSPVPQQMNTENLYSRVFCGNLITCFLDLEGHFSYFGVIIKQLGGNSSTVTTKNLLNDQNIDSKSIFLEKEFEELEDQKFKEIVIGNGFIGLLGNTGTLFTLEYNDKLTMLYSKYYLYNIVVAKNEIFGLAKDNVKIMENKNDNLNENKLINIANEEKIKTNYYLCRWSSKSSSENEVCSDTWMSTIWKFKDEFTNIIENGKLLDTNDNRNILLLLDSDEKYSANLNISVLNPNKKFLDLSATNNELSMLDMSMNNNSTINENIMMFNLNKKKIPEKILDYEADFDDSYNLKYKRTKAKSRSILKDLPYIGTIRSRSVSRILNKSYNASFQNSAINLNKSNFVNFGNNNISAIGPNTSTFMNKKSLLIPTSNNYKRGTGKIFTNKFNNYNNLSNQNKNNKNKNNNLNQNSKSSLSFNNNDLNEENNDIDNNFNNFSPSEYNNINSNNKNNQKEKEKENDNVNIYDQSIDVKERELNKYRTEIDDIIANYKNKQNIKKTNLLNKYGLSRENNINITNQERQENDMNYINNQNLSKDNIIDLNIKDQIENSNNGDNFNNINIENESPFKTDLNKRYEVENELNENIKSIKINNNNNQNEKKTNLFERIAQSSDKTIKNNNKIMKNIQHYFDINKVNSQKRNKRKNRNKSDNEIEFDLNREETFQNVNNNNKFRKNNSFEINNQLNLFISNSEISPLIPTKCLSEGNDILKDNNNNELYNNKPKNKNKYNNNFDIRGNKKAINIINKNGNVEYNDNELISSPAFYKGNTQNNRLSDLIINETNKNKDAKEKNLVINLKGNNKNQEIKNTKKNNFDYLTNKNKKNSRFSFGNSPIIKNNEELKDDITNLKEDILVIQNINNINLNCDKKQNKNKGISNIESSKKNIKNKKENNILINNKNNLEKDNNSNFKEIINTKQNKNKITKNNPKQNNINNAIYQSKNNTKVNDKNINKKIPSNLNNQKYINKNEEDDKKFSNKNNKSNQELPFSKTSQENNYYYQKNNNEKDHYKSDENANEKRNNNLPIKLEDIEKRNKPNYQKQNVEEYNIDDFNDNMNNKNEDREPNLNNCDYSENDINKNQLGNNINQKENNKNIFEKKNIYSYKFGEDKNKNKINIESNQNNVNYQMNDSINDNYNKSFNVGINKSSITYFIYLMQNYLRKKCYLLCAYEIANFQKKYEKNLSLKLLFMVVKKRIIFYKIKFFHRYKKIYKYLVKFNKDYKIICGDGSQRTKNYNIRGSKK